MTIYLHELRQGSKTFLIWTLSISAFMAMCIFLFPEMEGELGGVGDMFSSMGSFTAAFGMDRLDFGTLEGFYAIECGNIMSLGGAFFAAVISVNIISKEEKDRTAEFLFTHPVSRIRVLSGKAAAVLSQTASMNIIAVAVTSASIAAIGEAVPWDTVLHLHLAYLFCQIEIAMICFGISAFSRSSSFGAGLGLALVLYFMNLIANVSDKMEVLRYISPFGYAEAAEIVTAGELDTSLVICGLAAGLAVSLAGSLYYCRKDIIC